MDKLKRYRPQVEESLERVVYSCSIHAALGRLPTIPAPRSPVYVLRTPKGARQREYVSAASLLFLGLDEIRRPKLLTPERSRKGQIEFAEVSTDIAEGGAAIVLVEHDVTLPPTLVAAIDDVVDIDPVSREHLQTGAHDFLSLMLSDDQAAYLLGFPLDLLFAAMRPGRSFDDIVSRLRSSERPKVKTPPTLEQLGGYGAAKTWGLQLAEDLHAWRKGEIGWVDFGLLLSGPPGTGKTLYAAALARSCGLHFVATSVAKWQSRGHLGDMLGAMRASFKEAADKAPSLLFVDEFDSVGNRAHFEHDNAVYSTQVVNGLLEAIDGSDRCEGVVIVGATNHPDAIDPAFLRPGRLGRHIRIGLPGFQDRKTIARTYFGDEMSEADVDRIAVASEGMTGAHFADISKEVRRKARRQHRAVDGDLVIACFPPAIPLVGRERRVASVHEAGHAIVGVAIGYGTLQAVAVVREIRAASTMAGGAFFEINPGVLREKQSYLDEICMKLAGNAAECIVFRTATSGSGGSDDADLAVAADLATLMVVQYGMGEELRYLRASSLAERERLRRSMPHVEREVSRILARQQERARAILGSNRTTLEGLAHRLDTEGFLDGEEVRKTLSPGHVALSAYGLPDGADTAQMGGHRSGKSRSETSAGVSGGNSS